MNSFLSASVEDFLRTDVPRISENAPLADLARAYQNTGLHCVFVIDPSTNRLKGVVDDNLISYTVSLSKESPIDQLLAMAKTAPIAVPADAQIWEALKVMNGENASGSRLDVLPVVNADLSPIGVLTRNDLEVKAVKFSAAASGLT